MQIYTLLKEAKSAPALSGKIFYIKYGMTAGTPVIKFIDIDGEILHVVRNGRVLKRATGMDIKSTEGMIMLEDIKYILPTKGE